MLSDDLLDALAKFGDEDSQLNELKRILDGGSLGLYACPQPKSSAGFDPASFVAEVYADERMSEGLSIQRAGDDRLEKPEHEKWVAVPVMDSTIRSFVYVAKPQVPGERWRYAISGTVGRTFNDDFRIANPFVFKGVPVTIDEFSLVLLHLYTNRR
jgi:hypothetical protein